LCGLLLSACASPAARYYRLQTDALSSPAQTGAGPVVQIGPVALPAWLNRPQLVRDEGAGRVTLLARTEWAAPLPQLIAESLAQGVGAQLGWSQVQAWPSVSPYAADWVVTLDVRDLTAAENSVRLDASWRVMRAGQLLASGALKREVALSGQDADAIVAAHDQALSELASAIASSLRSIAR
jgi:hypothetical protein